MYPITWTHFLLSANKFFNSSLVLWTRIFDTISASSDNQHYEKIGKTVKCIEDEIPFEIPESWEWCRLNTLGEIVGGGTPSTGNSKFWNGDIAWLTPADMKYIKGKYASKGERMITKEGLSSSSTKLMPPNTILYSSRAPIGYIAISQNNLCTNQGFKSLVPISIDIVDYIYYCLIQRTKEIQSRATGTTFKEISGKEFGRTLIPIPPLNEQHQIVKIIDILMPYVEKYDFYEYKRNSLDHMISQELKKSILQYAIRGKLVPQDPNDEPASVLLERIRAEKEQLIKEGKIKRDKNESYIYRGSDNSYYERTNGQIIKIDEELPFEIPATWTWARLKHIFNMQAGNNISSSEISEAKDNRNIYKCYGGNGIRGYVDKYNNTGNHPIIGRQGALCGNIKLAQGNFYATEHAVVVTVFSNTDFNWAAIFLEALNLNQYATATAQPGLAVSKISNVLIPVPPACEQQQIYRRITELNNMLV